MVSNRSGAVKKTIGFFKGKGRRFESAVKKTSTQKTTTGKSHRFSCQ